MNQSRRSLFGLLAGASAVVAASRVADAAPVPVVPAVNGPILGEVRVIAAGYVDCYSHSHPMMQVADPSHTHTLSLAPVLRNMIWDGKAWVPFEDNWQRVHSAMGIA